MGAVRGVGLGGHKDTGMNSNGCKENVYVQCPDFCATPPGCGGDIKGCWSNPMCLLCRSALISCINNAL